MSKEKNNTEKWMQDKVEEVITSNIAYYRLWFFRTIAKSTTAFARFTIILFFSFFGLLFFSLTLAFLLSQLLDSYIWGFFIVGGLFFFIFCIIMLLRRKLIDKWILGKLHKLFSDK